MPGGGAKVPPALRLGINTPIGMTLHEKHMHRIELVNRSTTEAEHSTRERDLRNWRAGVEDAGLKLDLCAADWYYLDQGIDRPMCCGVWLDWEPLNSKVASDGSEMKELLGIFPEIELCRYCSGSGAIYIQGEAGAWEEPCPECSNPQIGTISLHNADVDASPPLTPQDDAQR